ncbi:hypothetical protein BKG82_12040 [Mycobacteroides chelonae]|jgi:hypothetical protein|uniref:Uncharacterized protein n=1 Tax=Mycobacteroides chelonae TaxID=1774 RepID=A0A1S1LSZ5_MYCCH|nr:hypothetical protein AOT87_26650 [Mycobacteroides sp. H003]KRQ34517.1 hypothetical protein AOT91_06400 [Mycobacteroides sp. H092]KRQ41500.1 hypothetical protein AOT92_12170 [Mycobacteroides sp. H101]KRQ43454.1 hypothetical protein AOT88_24190 [Mycobacteroides sp. H063]KRQ58086.1 hypothetical protein AOT94_14470 [Mycobacteroides sp. HXVII]KRQ65682.1 hypothetical protein AOT90_06415 [Mycobacteroides sp. H079]KRQ77791.1 hypothetical protein AOT93_19370 [Mycobacteroides sp. H110]KRQ83430.1 hy
MVTARALEEVDCGWGSVEPEAVIVKFRSGFSIYESRLELARLLLTDFDRAVTWIASQQVGQVNCHPIVQQTRASSS